MAFNDASNSHSDMKVDVPCAHNVDYSNRDMDNEDDESELYSFVHESSSRKSSHESIDVDVILSAKPWPNDINPKYGTFKEEVLSHEVICEPNWIRVVTESENALKVIHTLSYSTFSQCFA